MTTQPLAWPEAIRHPTDLQKVLMGFWFIGPDVRAYRDFRRQVAARPDEWVALWKHDPYLETVRDLVLDVFEKEMEWASRKFIPADPCDILLFDDSYSLDLKNAETFSALERLAGGELDLDAVLKMTLGELVDLIAARRAGGPLAGASCSPEEKQPSGPR